MRLIVHPGVRKSLIHPEIYGHFSEHLGRCIYGGVFVGKDSPIPNVNGMRTDVVEALQDAFVCRCCAGRAAALPTNTTGRTASARRRRARRWSTPTGAAWWRTIPSARTSSWSCAASLAASRTSTAIVGSGTVREMQEWVEYMTSAGRLPDGRSAPCERAGRAVGAQILRRGQRKLGLRRQHDGRVLRGRTTAATRPTCATTATTRIYKIACGAGTSMKNPDYDWTETLMQRGRAHDERPFPALLHRSIRQLAAQGLSATEF